MNATTIENTWTPITEDDVTRIVSIPDVALRNLWITQTYADLAHRLVTLLRTDQTWCSFAIWASNTAGVSIRCHELPHVVQELVDGAGEHADAVARQASDHHRLIGWLAKPMQRTHVDRLVQTALAQVSTHIAHGNTLVYSELAPLFIRFLDHVDVHGAPEQAAIDPLLDRIGVPYFADGPLVRTAFRHYAGALGLEDPRQRAQFVLTANVAAVLHEQQRLQGDIAASLDAGLIDVGDELDHLVHWVVPGPIRRRIAAAAQRRAEASIERLWEHVATRVLMTLMVPEQTLHLGVDVPPPAGQPLFPAVLAELDYTQLIGLMDAWDPTHGTGHGSGARDWADLHQRMGYIVNLFRSRQQRLVLTTPPFTAAQLATMTRGAVPGDL